MKAALPKDYQSYVEGGGTDSAYTEGDPGYFQLWPLEEVKNLNRDYRVDEYAQGFVGFGSDGGGEMLAFDSLGAVYMIPFVGMNVSEAKKIAASWSELLSRIQKQESV